MFVKTNFEERIFLMDNVWVNGIVYRLNRKNNTAKIVKVEEVYPVIVIPETVTDGADMFKVVSVETAVFHKLKDLRQVQLPSTIIKIGRHAFSECPNLEKIVCNNKQCMKIWNLAFTGCHSLTEIDISGEVILETNVFYNCRNIRQIKLHVVGDIVSGTFNGCPNLHELYFLSKKHIVINPNAIYYCPNLDTIHINGSVEDYAGILDLAYEGVSIRFANV